MRLIVGVAGFTGTGKTSAVAYLAPRLRARVVYLGQAVKDEVALRGLEAGAENERNVRLEMRAADPAALARRMLPQIRDILDRDISIVLDAIMSPAERDLLRAETGADTLVVLSMTAPVSLRLHRLANRAGRSATPQEVFSRDRTERGLGILDVVQNADCSIRNDRGRAAFHRALHDFKQRLSKV